MRRRRKRRSKRRRKHRWHRWFCKKDCECVLIMIVGIERGRGRTVDMHGVQGAAERVYIVMKTLKVVRDDSSSSL